jgi:hypothetical protein
VKRLVPLIIVGALIGAVWIMSSTSGGSSTASATVLVGDVSAFRGRLMTELARLGATNVGEQTDFSGEGSSEVKFRVPPAKLAQALQLLSQLGGQVTEQSTDTDIDTSGMSNVGDAVDSVNACIDAISGAAGSGSKKLQSQIEQCRSEGLTLDQRVAAVNGSTEPALLTVAIQPTEHSSPLTWIAIVLALLAGGGVAIFMLRKHREQTINLVDSHQPVIDPWISN